MPAASDHNTCHLPQHWALTMVPTPRTPRRFRSTAASGSTRSRACTCPPRLQRGLAVLLACTCASFLLVLRPSFLLLSRAAGEDATITSLSGHRYHPKLCSTALPGTDSTSNATSAAEAGGGGCSELHDARLASQLVTLPEDLHLVSNDTRVLQLHKLLAAAVQAQWPLPLARRLVRLLLHDTMPPVDDSSSSSNSNSSSSNAATHKQQQKQGTANPPVTASPPDITAKDSGHAPGWRFATQAFALLRSQGGSSLLVPCSFDPSLPLRFNTRFLFAAAWPSRHSMALPNTVLQLLDAAALLPPGLAYISIHAPSTAAAAVGTSAGSSLLWLDLLQLLAAALGVPVHMAAAQPVAAAGGPASSSGSQRQQDGATGFDHLNAALSPFFSWGRQHAAVPSPKAGTSSSSSRKEATQKAGRRRLSQARTAISKGSRPATTSSTGSRATNSSSTSGSSSSSSSGGLEGQGAPGSPAGAQVAHGGCPPGARADPSCFSPEYAVLLEPRLFFCAADVVRLLEYPEDMVCGLQLDEFKPVQLKHRRRLQAPAPAAVAHSSLQQQQQQHRQLLQQPQQPQQPQQQQAQQQVGPAAAAAAAGVLHEGPMAAAVAAAAASQAVLQPEVPLEFEMYALRAAYDATRDITGEMLSAHSPYFAHAPSGELARAGLPVPVYCCWGGLSKVTAAVFDGGVRFRTGLEGECRTPDAASLLCDDLRRTGHDRIVLDPGVRTSSQLRTKRLLEHPRFPFFLYTDNWETTAWFDIHPLLPLQYWNTTAVNSDNSSGGDDSLSDSDYSPLEAADAADVQDASSWAPGEGQMCCEGQQWSGAARPNHPTDCRRSDSLTGKNFTALFLHKCAQAASHGSQAGASLQGC